MNKVDRPWSPEQEEELVELRRAGLTLQQCAEKMGRSLASVEHKWKRLPKLPKNFNPGPTVAETLCKFMDQSHYPSAPGIQIPPLVVPEEDKTRFEYWKKRAKFMEKELADQQTLRTAQELLADEILNLAPKSYEPPAFNLARAQQHTAGHHGTAQSAVLMLSDTHVGQVVTPEQTNGLGNYNFEIFLRRLARLERSIFSIVRDHTTTEVPELVIAMLGDMINGNLEHSVEAGQVNTLFDQFYSAGHALAQFLRNLSALVPVVRVYACAGNHARWGTQKKSPTDNTYSNLDMFLAEYVKALVRDIPAIQITLDKNFFTKFEVQNWNFIATHGTHLRGGDRMLGIPAHAIGRNISAQSQLAARAGQELPNYYLVGHLHRPITLPHTMGEFIANGGFVGIDGFGLAEAFNSSPPSQKFFLIHPKFGRSATYDLRLDLGDDTEHGYQLPQTPFLCQ